MMLKSFPRIASTGAASAAALALATGAVGAAETNLRIQTHFSPETLSGQMAADSALMLVVFACFLIFGSFYQVFVVKFYKWEMFGTAFDFWLSRVRGGIAIVTSVMAVILAAMSGIIGGEVVLLGLIALPQMFRLSATTRTSPSARSVPTAPSER